MALLNKAEVKREVFRRIAAERPHLEGKLTRISESFYQRVEAQVRLLVAEEVRRMPTTGSTVR